MRALIPTLPAVQSCRKPTEKAKRERIGRRGKRTYSQMQGGEWVFVLKTTTQEKREENENTEGKKGRQQ